MQLANQSLHNNFSEYLLEVLYGQGSITINQDRDLNLLILNQLHLAALEVQGNLEIQGAYAILITLLTVITSKPTHRNTLITLADQYLAAVYADTNDAESQFKAMSFAAFARQQAQNAAQNAGDIHSWQGRLLNAWCNAAQQLIHTAQAIIGNHERSYIAEKNRTAMFSLVVGLQEGQAHNQNLITDDLTSAVLKTAMTSDS